ncbi:MAG: hypothetical protein HW412_1557 [Bacteroidetes bacterium]|nr:hypothetical protein [Bacteroidota bacterium]
MVLFRRVIPLSCLKTSTIIPNTESKVKTNVDTDNSAVSMPMLPQTCHDDVEHTTTMNGEEETLESQNVES